MESCRVIFNCDHEFNSVESVAGTVSVSRTAGADTDLIGDTVVSSVLCVYQMLTNAMKFFIDGTDFQLINNNSIKWLAEGVAPEDESVYFVEYISSRRVAESYELEACPRCAGNGWYAGILESSSVILSGLDKTVQDFLKIIFTDKDASTGYGSSFSSILGSPITSEYDMVTEVTAALNDCVTQLQNRQASATSSGVTLSDEEILVSVELTDYEYDAINSGLIVEFTFKNASNNSATLTLII